MIKYLLIGALMFTLGCKNEDIKDDAAQPAARSNYPTAEFSACGGIFHGLGACSILKGDNPNKLDFYIQGYYSGSLRIFSSECGLDKTVTYSDNEKIKIDLPNSLDSSCLLTFTVSPNYPTQDKNDITVYGFIGYLFIKVLLPDESWIWRANKFPQESSEYVDFAMEGSSARVVMISNLCGVRYDQQMPVQNGNIKLSTDFIKLYNDKCILNGVMIGESSRRYFTWMSYRYDKYFVPLAVPKISFDKKGRLKVIADEAVTSISLNDQYVMNSEARFEFDKNQKNILRALTVKGRSVIGVYENGGWTWFQ